MINALSVDVEDYFMVENFAATIRFEDWEKYPLRLEKSTGKLLEIFRKCKVKATFFVLGWVAEKLPRLVQQVAAEGHEIACHGYSHRRVDELGKERFAEEIKKAKLILENLVGKPVVGYRAATYSLNEKTPWAWDILAEAGFRYDSSYRPFLGHILPRMPVNRAEEIRTKGGKTLVEFPITVEKILGLRLPLYGGGYLRLFPISWIAGGIRRLNARGMPANVHLHPWEVDPEQPRLPASPLARFRHYVNLARTEEKLAFLLQRFSFAPIREVLSL